MTRGGRGEHVYYNTQGGLKFCPICYNEEERWREVLGTDGNGEGCGRWQRTDTRIQ